LRSAGTFPPFSAKALDIDSSLKARRALAKELNYTGDMNGSASSWSCDYIFPAMISDAGFLRAGGANMVNGAAAKQQFAERPSPTAAACPAEMVDP
jgi:hypothetical protein